MTSYYIDNTGIYANDDRMLPNHQGTVAFEWLLADNPKQNKLLYDLDACVASLIHMAMSEVQAQALYEKEKVWIGNYKITYFPNRFFAIDGRRHYVNFGNMLRYKSDTHYSPDDNLQDKINKAKEAEEIAREAGSVLGSMMLDPQRIISPVAAIIDKYIKPLRVSTVDDMPEEVGQLAYQTIKGNWLEAYQLGYWEDALDYDINGAYGSILARLLDLRRGVWMQDTTMPSDAVYGFAQGVLNTMSPFHPFMVKVSDDFNYFPVGEREDVLTKSQIDLLNKHKLGEFTVNNGWWWIPDKSKDKYEPLKGIVNHLWNIRSKAEGLKKAIIRQMLAGIWGRMIEVKKDEFGELFNPVWGSIVENDVKCIVADACLSAGVNPLQVAVDGVITDKPLPIQDTKELGGWRLSHKGKCIIVSSGVVGFEGKSGAEEFAMSYDWLNEQLTNYPDKSEYTMDKYSPITLAKALKTSGFDKLGELENITRSVVVGKDYKRMWKDYPKCGGDLLRNRYGSMPIDVTMAGVGV